MLRGSTDGFDSEIFHLKCDNKGKMVCIIKDTTGKIFGAYTDVNFDKNYHKRAG